MECCTPSKADFLEQKLKNFRAFLEPFVKTPEQKEKLVPYKDMNSVMPLLFQALALRKASPDSLQATLDSMARELDMDAEAQKKLRRYMDMFCDVIIS